MTIDTNQVIHRPRGSRLSRLAVGPFAILVSLACGSCDSCGDARDRTSRGSEQIQCGAGCCDGLHRCEEGGGVPKSGSQSCWDSQTRCGTQCRDKAAHVCSICACLLRGGGTDCTAHQTVCGEECSDNANPECEGGACVEKSGPSPCRAGKVCGDGQVCSSAGECVNGCFIGGLWYVHGDTSPNNTCVSCQPINETSWTPVTVGTECGPGRICENSNQCVDGCFISGSRYARGSVNSSNPCEICGAAYTNSWTKADPGTTCGDGLVCGADNVCASGCYIGGKKYAIGEANRSNACKVCKAASGNVWTDASEGTTCAVGKVCDGSDGCGNGCFIEGKRILRGTVNASNACESCTAVSTTTWTSAAEGTICGAMNVCNATGDCVQGCFIGGKRYENGAENPSNACQSCTAASPTSWTIASEGKACGSGTVCNAAGKCVNGMLHWWKSLFAQ